MQFSVIRAHHVTGDITPSHPWASVASGCSYQCGDLLLSVHAMMSIHTPLLLPHFLTAWVHPTPSSCFSRSLNSKELCLDQGPLLEGPTAW